MSRPQTPPTTLSDTTFPGLFEGQVARTPGAVAVSGPDGVLTYEGLNGAANRLAHRLIARFGVGPEDVVALAVPRSALMVTALLAVLKTGAAYLPLDVSQPVRRTSAVLEAVGPVLTLTTGGQADGLPRTSVPLVCLDTLSCAGEPATDPTDDERTAALDPRHPAYLIHTSGTTGTPKGVITTHAGLAALAATQNERFALDSTSRVLQLASMSFDAAVMEVLMAFAAGGTLVLPRPGPLAGDELARTLAEARITHALIPPATLATVPHGDFPDLRTLVVGGEACPAELARLWSAGRRMVNAYGPTESTACATASGPLTGDGAPPLGTAVRDTDVYVLDEALCPVPAGAVGEVYLAGAALARGYHGRPSLTGERFVADPYGPPGARMYRTGDLAVRSPDGTLFHRGRGDQQVKIRGFRIEPEEIQHVLLGHPRVLQAAVVPHTGPDGDTRLTAYTVTTRATSPEHDGADSLVRGWQELYDDVYASSRDTAFGENFFGWNRSEDGEPIPLEEMREWQDRTVDRILSLSPRRVLEIGAGSGLLLARIAPRCASYLATDLSPEAVGALREHIAADPELAGRVRVECRAADALDGLDDMPEGGFDTVIVNSVTQYFPSGTYLVDVLTEAFRLVAPGGSLFVGDVRDRRLLRAFHTSVALGRAGSGTDDPDPAAAVARDIARDIAREEELLVDPELFTALAAALPDVAGVDLRVKRGRFHNELTRYRYDAVLRRRPSSATDVRQAARLVWGQDVTSLDALSARLTDPDALPVRLVGVPDARVAPHLAAAAAVLAGATVREARAAAERAGGVDPEDLCARGEREGLTVAVAPSPGAEGHVDALFLPYAGTEAALTGTYTGTGTGEAHASPARYATCPSAVRDDGEFTAGLRRWLEERLPAHMVPSGFVVLDALPLTSHGKLDRKALPVPQAPARNPLGRAPRSPQEGVLAGLFAEVLGVPSVTVDDNFFELGGHSLLATRLISRIRTTLHTELPLATLFQHPTVAALTPHLNTTTTGRPVLEPVPRPDVLAPSPAQARMWFLNRLDTSLPTYVEPLAFSLEGPLDRQALSEALADVVDRHESLRTVFPEDADGPRQAVHGPGAGRTLLTVEQVHDAGQLQRRIHEEATRGFDLAHELPLRARLFALGPEEHTVLLCLHHVVADGWSLAPLVRDVGRAYAARLSGSAPGWAPLRVQYADYTIWQERLLGDAGDPASTRARQLAYWRQQLAGLPEDIALPADRPRPATPSGRGAQLGVVLPAPLLRKLTALATHTGTTLFMVLQAGLSALLTRLGAGEDIPLGSPVAGRTDDALDEQVGFFVNTLVLRTDTSGNPTFRQLLDRVRVTDLGAWAHQDLPFEQIVEALNPRRATSRQPLFQVMLAVQNAPTAALSLPGVNAGPMTMVDTGTAKLDLVLSLGEVPGTDGAPATLRGFAEYDSDRFDASTVTALLARLARLLDAVADSPDTRTGDIDLLTEEERHQVLELPNRTHRARPTRTLPGLFEGQVARTPGAVAVSGPDGVLTYEGLNGAANRLAHRLIARFGVGPEDVVALAVPRSALMVTALLAVLKTGAAYLPLDVSQPVRRTSAVLEAVGPVLTLTTGGQADGLPRTSVPLVCLDTLSCAGEPVTDPTDDERTAALDPRHPAYLIHTSGTTGTPKGVVMPAGALCNLLLWHAEQELAGETASTDTPPVVALFTSLSFDVSVQEILSALTTGKALAVPDEDTRRDPDAFVRWLDRERVGELFAPNLVIDMAAEAAERAGLPLPSLRTIVQAGEALIPGPALLRFLDADPSRRLHNHYGPTESHVVTACEVPLDTARHPQDIPLGDALSNVRVYVLDEALCPVPAGAVGEVYLAGAALARGYHGRPSLTGERFVADPYGPPGARMYRTGDLAVRRQDGSLLHRGRGDQQVKIRGFRIEPEEIQQVLLGHPGVLQAAVVPHTGPDGDTCLTAYTVTATAPGPTTAGLRRWLEERLPAHMVPSGFVVLDALPLTSHGKLDRKALPVPQAPARNPFGRAPRSPQEGVLAGLFAEVLGVPSVTVDDNFFELGGHSLLATRLISRIRTTLHTELPLTTLFQHPTVAALTPHLDTTTTGHATGILLPLRREGTLPPLFCIHPGAGPSWCYAPLLPYVDPDRPVYGIQTPALTDPDFAPESVEELAHWYLLHLRRVQPDGPYHLLGWSFGGLVAHAIATALRAAGEEVAFLSVVDGYPAEAFPEEPRPDTAGATEDEGLTAVLAATDPELWPSLRRGFAHHLRVARTHRPRRFAGDMLLVSAAHDGPWRRLHEAWDPYVSGTCTTARVPCGHHDLFSPGWIGTTGPLLADALRTATTPRPDRER